MLVLPFRGFAAMTAKIVFQATDGTNGLELWITDGTAVGTSLLKDINAGGASSSPGFITSLGSGRALFSASDGTNSLFFRNVVTVDGWPMPAMGWVMVKASVSALLASLTSIAIGLRPKESSIAVSQAVANAIVVGVIVALLVHAVVSTLTAI